MRDCDEMESWIAQKEAVVKTEEKGANKDRVESMQKKFDVRTATNFLIKILLKFCRTL